MTSRANITRFVENETGAEVLVETLYTWAPNQTMHVVEYPGHSKRYGISEETLNRHFTIVSPQTIEINALAIDMRPTQKQAELDAAITQRMADTMTVSTEGE